MAKEVIMPALGMAQDTGILVQWYRKEGESVTQGEPLMEIETDKATVEVEAPASGMLANITAQPGDEIPVGQAIAMILSRGEERSLPVAAQDNATPARLDARSTTAPAASPVAARIAREHNIDLRAIKTPGERIQKDDVLLHLKAIEEGAASSTGGRTLASPKARRLARERSLDLATITGSGPDGAVLAADVEATGDVARSGDESPAVAAASDRISPTPRMWRVMSQRLTESWNTVPHFYLEREVNASQLLTWWHGSMERVSEQITLTDLLVKVVASALRQHPRVNAGRRGDDILLYAAVNVGIAVAVDDGLMVPVIREADRLGLKSLSNQRQELVARARSGKIRPDDLADGTFTISNLGMFGVDSFNAIVNAPQAAILAVGRIADRVVAFDGRPAVQPMMTLTLSCDHRIVDGAIGARFLQTIVSRIEAPMALLD